MTTDTATIVLATTNSGKLREVRAAFAELPVCWKCLHEFRSLSEPVEDADTFEGNAKLKALHYARLTNRPALADDSGLEVDALGGAPGVRSARYAGPQCDAAANNARLIEQLADVPLEHRTARFRCVIVLATPEQAVATASGALEGIIIDRAKGENGFGYDPYFFVPVLNMTVAQMTIRQKNGVSHRGRALASIRPKLESLLSNAAL